MNDLTLNVTEDNGLFIVENDSYSIFGCGGSINDAIEDAVDCLDFMWGEIVLCDEDWLDDKTKELRERLKNLKGENVGAIIRNAKRNYVTKE